MKYMILIYIDDQLINALPPGKFDSLMLGCLNHADELRSAGTLLDSQQLEPHNTAKTLRVRSGASSIVDGPFAETKEYLGGFNLIEAASFDDALRIAKEFPWASLGSIEIREVRDMNEVRKRVSHA